MKKALLLIAASMFVLAGCQKEESVKESTSNNVIHIGVKQLNSPATRVIANSDELANTTPGTDVVSFYWEEGDEVAFSPDGEEEIITIFKCINTTSKEFTKQSGPDLDPAKTYYFIYPANFDPDIYYASAYHEVHRSNQIPKEHRIDGMGLGSSDEFTLNYHSNLLHLALKGNVTIGKIEYQYLNSPSAVLDCGTEGVQLNTETPTNFYIDFQNYPNEGQKFKFVLKDIEGGIIEEISSSFALSDYESEYNIIIDFPEHEVPSK